MSYRMEQLTREQIAAADPFEGRGIFLAAPGSSVAEILGRVAGCLGPAVPAVAWDGSGAWIDPGSNGMSTASVRDRWDGGRTSEHG